MPAVIGALPQLEKMAELLSQSQLIPEQLRNKADCFALCLNAMQGEKLPLALVAQNKYCSQPADETFITLTKALVSAVNEDELNQATSLMESMTAGGRALPEEQSSALLSIHARSAAFIGATASTTG